MCVYIYIYIYIHIGCGLQTGSHILSVTLFTLRPPRPDPRRPPRSRARRLRQKSYTCYKMYQTLYKFETRGGHREAGRCAVSARDARRTAGAGGQPRTPGSPPPAKTKHMRHVGRPSCCYPLF